MYSYADRVRAVELYVKLGKRTGATIRQLGYGDADKNLDWFYVVSPRLSRYSLGLGDPREILIRFSSYQRI